MLRTLLLVAFSTLLIAQFGLCLPKPTSSEAAENNNVAQSAQTTTPLPEESNLPNARQRLELLAYKTLLIFLNSELQKSNQLVKDVLADPSMNNIDNDAMEHEKSVLRKYVSESEESLVATLPSNKNDHENRLVFAFEKTVVLGSLHHFVQRLSSDTEELTPEQQITWDALKEHGFLEYRTELDKLKQEFMCNWADEFANFMKTLSAAEKERAKDMVEAWNGYTKNEFGLSKDQLGQHLFTLLLNFDSDTVHEMAQKGNK
ncbi:uncharacterized protein LOC128863861 isoform X1 [Anastrepha ludens]|uniref:uncharacterized protein LOC128863861 isoform X1 n=1 Tax=Anastrepha ludens TaxID=28586 RepID=UPI0023AE7C2F|nr:uncharacterized protein LOC128863861 isoform X1 [Anastrepha ludens]